MIPQYQYLNFTDLSLKYKTKPYQCTNCFEVFTTLGAYLRHAKPSLYKGKCPSQDQLSRSGLTQLPNTYWVLIPKVQLDVTQSEVLSDLEAKSFVLADFKKKPRQLPKDKRNGRIFEEMALDTKDYQILTIEQINLRNYLSRQARPHYTDQVTGQVIWPHLSIHNQ